MGGEGDRHGKGEFTCGLLKEHPYQISRYPVTVAQYQGFVDEKGYEKQEFWTKSGWEWRKGENITGPQDFDPVFQTGGVDTSYLAALLPTLTKARP